MALAAKFHKVAAYRRPILTAEKAWQIDLRDLRNGFEREDGLSDDKAQKPTHSPL